MMLPSRALVVLFLTLSLFPQEPVAAPSNSFKSARMGIAVMYPPIVGLIREDPGDLKHRSYRSVYAVHPEADPDHSGLDPCSPLVIAFGMGADKKRDPDEAVKPGEVYRLAPTGGITLSEIIPKCMPSTANQDMANLVGGIQLIKGLKPLSQITSYRVQNVDVFFAAVSGPSKVDEGKRTASAGVTLVGSIATIVNGHILLWSIVANDPQLFNQFIKLTVCFNPTGCKDSEYSRLVPYDLASRP